MLSSMEESVTSSSRESIAGGLIGLLKPAVEELDERVLAVRYVHIWCALHNKVFRYSLDCMQGKFLPESLDIMDLSLIHI